MSEPFSASRAARFMSCHASAHLDLAIPNWTPPDVDPTAGAKGKGTLLHEMLEPIVKLSASEMAAMGEAITYVAEIRARRRFQVLVEHHIRADWLPSQPWTTADLVLHVADELHIIDFKFGKIPVDVVGNEQLMYYALSYGHLAPKAKEVHLHIVQPFADNMEEWVADTNDLKNFAIKATAADKAITAGSTTFGPSDNCTFCPANPHSRGDKGRPLCPAMMNMLYPPIIHEDEILTL